MADADEVAAPAAILLLDGLFVHREELWRIWDYSVFHDVDITVSLARCAGRGTAWTSARVDAPSNRRYVEGQRIYLSRCEPHKRATRVIDNNTLAAPRIVR